MSRTCLKLNLGQTFVSTGTMEQETAWFKPSAPSLFNYACRTAYVRVKEFEFWGTLWTGLLHSTWQWWFCTWAFGMWPKLCSFRTFSHEWLWWQDRQKVCDDVDDDDYDVDRWKNNHSVLRWVMTVVTSLVACVLNGFPNIYRITLCVHWHLARRELYLVPSSSVMKCRRPWGLCVVVWLLFFIHFLHDVSCVNVRMALV